jgi:hypothetical protein
VLSNSRVCKTKCQRVNDTLAHTFFSSSATTCSRFACRALSAAIFSCSLCRVRSEGTALAAMSKQPPASCTAQCAHLFRLPDLKAGQALSIVQCGAFPLPLIDFCCFSVRNLQQEGHVGFDLCGCRCSFATASSAERPCICDSSRCENARTV